MKNSLLYKLAVLLSLMVLSTIGASAQRLTDYTVTESIGTYESVSGGTVLESNDDDGSQTFALPFSFKLDEKTYTYGTACSNGWLRLSNSSSGTYLSSYNPGYSGQDGIIHMFANDGFVGGTISYVTLGTAPNRICVVQWTNYCINYSDSPHRTMNFQIRLYETSNKLELIIGPGCTSSSTAVSGAATLAVSGNYITGTSGNMNYVNINPGSPSTLYYNNNNSRFVTSSSLDYLVAGKTYSFTTYPSLATIYPTKDAPLALGSIYGGTQQPGFTMSNIQANSPACFVRYQIAGPDDATNSNYKVIYDGLIEGGSDADVMLPATVNGLTRITEAKGIAARRSDGALDLLTNESQIPPGKYYITATLIMPSVNQSVATQQRIYISYPNDLAVAGISVPKTKKYALSQGRVNVQGQITNRGANPIPRFTATAVIRNVASGEVVYTSTATWANQLNPLTTGSSVSIDFDPFQFPTRAGKFSVTITASLTGNVTDDDLTSNTYPENGDPNYIFQTMYEEEPQADFVVKPTGTIYVGVPVRPTVQFTNNGMGDMTNITVKLKIEKYPGGQSVYSEQTYIMPDLPNGQANYGIWPEFIPSQEGQYKVTAWVVYADDPEPDNNQCEAIFTVAPPLSGTYSIGQKNLGQSRNYPTIQDAVNALYVLGVGGPVIFEFTDPQYQIGNIYDTYHPAIDMSSTIVGMSAVNTVTFKPDRERSQTYGGAEIVINTGNGVGFLIGQNNKPNNMLAPVYQVKTSRIREFSNSLGYFIFDGGINKSLKFTMNTNSNYRTAFYLSNGASNNKITNCIITDGNLSNPSTANSIPLSRYNLAQFKFEFEDDLRSDGPTYTSGIILRSVPPIDLKMGGVNAYNLDTLYSVNNVISSNEISGFSYGITSLGVGPVFNQYVARYQKFYNRKNQFLNNKIYEVKRAGIFLGFEDSTLVKNNRIYSVIGISGKESAGIMAGGEGRSGFMPYNNINMLIDGNEISDVSSSVTSYGIRYEQSYNTYPYGGHFVGFPDVSENTTIYNNIIWGLKTTNATASKFGVRLYTTRANNASFTYSDFLTPVTNTYFTNNDKIYNNTIYVVSDSPVQSSGMLAGLAVQNVQNTKVYNNAIAFLDADVSSSSPLASCIFYDGMLPLEANYISDRNAFQIANGSLASIYGFVQTDDHTRFLEGTRDDYKTIYQWQQWTKQDFNSVVGLFTQDLNFSGLQPNQKLRINSNPLPLGSLLNNRGEKLGEVLTDIDGVYRGQGGQRYDIGACEFFGRLYTEDLSVENIKAPGSYRAYSGTYSDAEYVMTTTPIDVKALIRNNGANARNSINATLVVTRQNPTNGWDTVGVMTKLFSVDPSATAEVTFPLNELAPAVVPESYRKLKDRNIVYNVPTQFLAMQANVSPLYQFDVLLNFTELRNDNNSLGKRVRFYTPADNLNMLVSGENIVTGITPNGNKDIIAGRLNYDSLASGLKKLGWYSNVVKHSGDTLVYDVFDRTGWEPKAIDYSFYRTMFWSDGDDKPITRNQRKDFRNFLNTTSSNKKNLIIGSQDIVRQLIAIDTVGLNLTASQYDSYAETQRINKDTSLCTDILQTVTNYPTNPLGYNVSCHGNQFIGVTVGKTFVEDIARTGYTGDAEPYCANLTTSESGEGLSSVAYKWKKYNKNTYIGWAVGGNGTLINITADTVSVDPQFYQVDVMKKFNSVSFYDFKAGWMVGEQGTIVKTIDGGRNWTQEASGTNEELLSVDFADNLNGWAVGANGTLLKTTDGGNNWSLSIMGDKLNLNSVFFVNKDLGFIGGSMGRIVRVTNNGTQWDQMVTNTTQAIFGMYFIDDQTGWAVGGGGTILKTVNQGNSWSTLTSNTINSLYAIHFYNQNVGWGIGANGYITRTLDGGRTWNSVVSPVTTQLTAVFATDSLGAIVLGKNGLFMRTNDAGATWTQFKTLTQQSLYGIYMLDNNKSSMGISSNSQVKNTLVLGADWRHYKNSERLFRSVYDFVVKNGGTIVPVELTDFEANLIGKKVELNWATRF